MTTVDPKAILESLGLAVLVVRDDVVVHANAAGHRLLGRDPVGAALDELLEFAGPVPAPDQPFEPRIAQALTPDGAQSVRVSRHPLEGTPEDLIVCLDRHPLSRTQDVVRQLSSSLSSGETLARLEQFLGALEPILAELNWRGGLLRARGTEAEVLALLRMDGDDPMARLTRTWLPEGHVFPQGELPGVGQVAETGEPLVIYDPAAFGPALAIAPVVEAADELGIRAALIPLETPGGERWVLFMFGPDISDEDVSALQLVGSLLTAALHLEAMRRQVVRGERLAALGDMAASLAHEVRNPLAVIFNVVSSLRRAMDNPELTNLLDILGEEADRIERVIKELVLFVRPTVPVPARVLAHELAASALERARAAVPEPLRSHPVQVLVPDDLPTLWVDRALAELALSNVLDNALRAGAPDEEVSLLALSEDRGLRYTVINSGGPLEGEARARAFEPFFSTRATGTGLGLAIARRAVDDLGGELTLDETSTGTSFSIWLPTYQDPSR